LSIHQIINLLASIALVELMLTIGLGTTFAELAGVVRNWRLVGKAALANYVCVPLIAVLLLLLFEAHPLVAAGFFVAAACPGAPFGPPFTRMARGNVVVSVGLMVILAASSALIAPLLLHILLPLTCGDEPVDVDLVKTVGTLLLTQLLPLGVGLALRQWRPALAEKLKKPAGLLSVVLNLALLTTIVIVQFDMLIGIRLVAYAGMFALVSASVAVGWLLGGPGRDTRTAMAMATSVRNVGVTLVIVTATASLAGTPAVTAATAFGIFQTIFMLLAALAWGRIEGFRRLSTRITFNLCARHQVDSTV
jgi:BASS family bile acid:Na+ symporter